MEYLKARREDLGQVYQLVQDTIQTIYPQYYPHEIVGFFSNLHSKETIAADIDSGYVRVLVSDNCLLIAPDFECLAWFGISRNSFTCTTN